MESTEILFKQLIAHQLELTKETWKRLQEHGFDRKSNVRLDFSYIANDEADGLALAAFLKEETDYDVRVQSDLTQRWWVRGTTQETGIDFEVLRDWVKWMVLAGYEHGRCVFDGWGTEIP